MTDQNEDTSFEDAFNELADGEDHVELQEEGQEEGQEVLSEAPEPKPEPEPEIKSEGQDELEKYKQEIQQWQHKYNSDLGRQNALQRKIEALEQENQKLKKAPNPQGSGLSNKEWDELKQDFPEIAKAMESRLSQVEDRFKSQYDQKIQEFEVEIQRRRASEAEEYRKSQYHLLEEQHPDWQDSIQSQEYQAWLVNQPEAVKAIARDSQDARDAAYILSTFKLATGKTHNLNQSDDLKQKRERKLQQAQTVPTRSGNQRSNMPPDDDFEAAFNFFADR